ncbi:hypothetical protein F5Y05DRAFT_415666 [Hypoxylon sp. FL0543]|nr:hypothetical protein F5Y05DRAFT_415666 [Hypoxylon sp. FL0543]
MNREKWPRTLPNEIWRMIAQYLPPQLLLPAAHEQAFKICIPDSVVDPTRDIYAQFVTIEGTFYIQELSNTAFSGRRGRHLFRGRPTRPVLKIHIAEDHLGVRGIKFSSSGSDDSPGNTPDIPGVWWRCVSASSWRGIGMIRARSDGFKVRDVRIIKFEGDIGSEPKGIDCLRWQVWNPPPVTLMNLKTLWANSVAPGSFHRMQSFDCNAPDVTGYSVAITGESVLTIHSHRKDTDLSFYQDTPLLRIPTMWIYMPIDEGEYVKDICRYYPATSTNPGHRIGLTFTTNRGRTAVFGPYERLRVGGGNHTRVYSPPEKPTQIYFDVVDQLEPGIRMLAFENPVLPIPMTVPDSAFPMTREFSEYIWSHIYSSCPMKGVAAIIPCVDKTKPEKLVIGMLLIYKDGHRECLGQMRFDWMVDPLVVGPASKLRIGMSRTKIVCSLLGFHTIRNVAAVTLGVSKNPNVDRWIDVPWHGTLEWSFTPKLTIIRHDNRVK